jgi:hypothetical protein
MEDTVVDQICEQLLQIGRKLSEIEQLWDFLHRYVPNSQDRANVDACHLEFLRWLIRSGKFGDDLSA